MTVLVPLGSRSTYVLVEELAMDRGWFARGQVADGVFGATVEAP